ncbi:hypothetical protein FSP39_005168 [Pinctada imbricata]|uniref:Virilizer N-terminal domain-containing protein n=1 Tax=Pinctada imbricata TaxID=66713 RepID=A0AA88XYC5_PINIB|nr:hypothetical protein FSP39_005168 [Pinctada imbricata]
MSEMEKEWELLFFDTFSHENAEELNLDLVQFPRPVVIYEVRVIPLQTRVEADVPGGVRLGATNPSAFKLELFVNNLNKPNAATFEKLGSLDYKENVDIQMKSDGEIPTDGLILKGWYNTLTVAIYGTLTVVKPEQVSPPPPPPPNRAKQVVDTKISQVSDTNTRAEWEPPKHPAKPQQQHPLDYINQQVQLQQKQQQAAQAMGSMSHPPPGGPAPGAQQGVPPNIPPQGQHRDILHDFISSPKLGHHDHRDGREPGQYAEGREREQFESSQGFRAPRDSNSREREYERSRESSREKEYRDTRDEERKRREKEWEKFRERERERSRERERERERSREKDRESRDWPQSPTRRRSWSSRSRSPSHSRSSRSRSRSRSYTRSRSPMRSVSRSPRRSVSRSPRRSYSRSPRRSRTPIRSRSRTPVRTRSPIRSRSYSRSPERRSLSPPKPPVAQPVPVLETPQSPGAPPSAPPPREMSPIQQITVIQRFPRDPSPPRIMREHSPTQEEIMEAGEIIDEIGESELFDPLSPDQAGYQDEAEPEVDDTYENISSDEELTVMDEGVDDLQDFEEVDESWTFPSPVYNPFVTELSQLKTFPDLSKTDYEVEKETLQRADNSAQTIPEEAKSLLDIMEELKEAPHHDKWVVALEGVPKLLTKGLPYIIHVQKRMDVLDTLLDWAMEGVDEEKARVQPESAFKVRHLKMGIKLVGCLCCCDPDITKALMERNVQHKLIDLFESPCMSFSLKIQIVRALDQTTRLTCGLEHFLSDTPVSTATGEGQQAGTGYQRILNVMAKKYNVRVVACLLVFVRKVHMYEVLTSTKTMIERVIENESKQNENKPKDTPDSPIKSPGEPDLDGNLEGYVITETDAEALIANLLEIIKVFTISPHLIGQPRRSLPSKSVFEIKNPPYDPRPDLFTMANSCGLLESIFLLLTTPSTCGHPLLFGTIREFIQTLLQSYEGLLYLSSQPTTVNGIIKCLLQIPDEGRDEAVDESPTQQLGLEMVFCLQTLQYVDKLNKHHALEAEKEADEANVMTAIHELYTMTLNPVGRQQVISVLSLEKMIDPILKLAEKTGDEAKDSKRKKSACVAYSMGLLLLVIRHSTNIDVYKTFGERLVQLSEEDFSSKLLEMQEWLQPVKAITDLTYEGVSQAVTQLKQYTEDLHKIPRGLITTMRILRQLAITPYRKYPDDTPEELKYKYTLLELYSADTFSLCTNILQKVSEILLRPWQRGLPQSSEQISYHLAIIKPTLEIVKETLCYIIAARGAEFKDLTALPILFEVYTVLCSVPISSYHDEELLEIQNHILDALMAYTQPLPEQAESEEALSQSLWTKTLKELLKYTIKAPYTYLSGLLLMSELLPVPLPLQSKEPLGEADVTMVQNTRKLWSVHLHSLTSQIQEMIRILATSTCQPLQQVLRRVCWQLSDLSAPTATMITRCILDMVIESFQTLKRPLIDRKEEGEGGEDRVERVSSPYASKMLNLLAFVLSQPSIKCAALQLMMQTGEVKEEKYGELMPQLLEILNTAFESVPHIQAQECIVSILQSICDPEVALVMGENITVSDQIAYALPNGNYMTQITTSLLDHMGSADHSYASILPCVRTLVMLTEHDYGFYYLKTVLEQKTTAIGRLMVRINTTFSKDSSDCLSTLSTLLEFLRLLMVVDVPGDNGITVTRTSTLSQKELQEVLSWNPNMENHPLLDLEKLLEESAKEEETLESLLDNMTGLMKMLRDTEKVKQENISLTEPKLPLLESLSTLYNMRSVFVISDMDDERLNPDYWLSNPATDVADIEPDLIMYNMDDMCKKYCAEFNLEEELKKTVSTSQAELTKPRRVKIGDRRKSQEISIFRGKGFRKPFVAPMRGRGIARGMMGSSSRMDSFRTRAPNTSRPPSMHVDDFMKLEKDQTDEENRSSGPQVSPIRRVDSIVQNRDNRGRGFDRGRGNRFFPGNRNRFFSPQGNYGRREPSNNIYVGGGGGNTGGGTGYNRPSQQNFGHGYQGSGDRRGDQRDFRFNPTGGYYKDQGGRFMDSGFGRRDNSGDRGRHARSFTK